MKPAWEDMTPHLAGYNGQTGKVWRIYKMGVSVVVERLAAQDPRDWFVVCYEAGLMEHKLLARDIGAAKAEALIMVRETLEARLRAVHEMEQAT